MTLTTERVAPVVPAVVPPATSGTALLRSAGLPLELWLAAGAPQVFAAVRELDRAGRELAAHAAVTADRIGTDVVPHVAAGPRRTALAVRRALHRVTQDPAPLGERTAGALDELRPHLDRDLAAALDALAARSRRLADRLVAAEAAVDAERDRLGPLPWALLNGSAVGRYLLRDGSLAAATDVPARLAAGEPWDSKRMRRRSEYLWRMISRGATKTTPRSWLGHLALLPVADGRPAPELTHRAAGQWLDNVHAARRPDPGDAVRWWFEPLHLLDDNSLRLWVSDADDPTLAVPTRLRATPPVRALRTALRGGALGFDAVAAALLPAGADEPQRAALRALLDGLVVIGVLHGARTVCREVTGWREPTAGGTITTRPRDGFLDVHRVAAGAVPARDAAGWHADLVQVLRLHRLMDLDAPPPDPAPDGERPVLDALADHLDALRHDPPPPPAHLNGRWPAPSGRHPGYARLVAAIGAAGAAGRPVELDAARLDRIGAPDAAEAALHWPVDAVLRPLPGGGAVLGSIDPAGVLDARFADALGDLHGEPAHQADYREFLDRLREHTGVESVELLVPPLSDGAANAVRRPRYTTAWTGDPDVTTHLLPALAGPGPRHLPLDELSVRTEDGHTTVRHRGRPVRILYHATRYPQEPWRQVYRMLLASSAQQRCRLRRLAGSLGALPDACHAPRVTLGSLVLAPAQWRVPADRLRAPAATDLGAVRALDRLRVEHGMPRWVYAALRPGGKPLACDLESLRTPRLLADLAGVAGLAAAEGSVDTAEIVLSEMLPGPDDLTVHDRLGGRVATELLLRFGATGPVPAP